MMTTPNPTNPLEHNNRAVELGSKGLWADAIREHEIALEGDPYNEQFKTNLSGACLRYGDMLASKKKYYEAMVQYRKALFADPANARTLVERLRSAYPGSKIVGVDLPDGRRYRVYAGQFQTEVAAEQAAAHLRRALETDPFIVRDDAPGATTGNP